MSTEVMPMYVLVPFVGLMYVACVLGLALIFSILRDCW